MEEVLKALLEDWIMVDDCWDRVDITSVISRYKKCSNTNSLHESIVDVQSIQAHVSLDNSKPGIGSSVTPHSAFMAKATPATHFASMSLLCKAPYHDNQHSNHRSL